ncbi:ABC transporter permease [Arsenicicoccus cauae]|uniref:ABC transporter permease n=1 Tax=Arsenicicoccus cauae TaxID=2663847 RepID=UPI00370D8E45
MSTQMAPGTHPSPSTPAAQGAAAPGGGRAPRNAWQLVAAREMAVKLRDKNFLVGTLVTMFLLVGVMGLQGWMASRSTTTRIAVVSAEGRALADAVGAAVKGADQDDAVEVTQVADQAAAESLVTEDKADVAVVRSGQGWQLLGKDTPDGSLTTTTRQVLQSQVLAATAAKAGTTPQQVQEQTAVTTRALSGTDEGTMVTARVVGLVFAMLFYFAALMFGMQIAQSVIEEKQSRIIEILASAIPVRQLLAGKVLGNTVMAMGQIVLYVGVGLIGMSFTPLKSMLAGIAGGAVWYLLFFLAGFLALACIWAVAGSLATRNEDLQQTTTPLTMVLIIGFFASFMAAGVWRVALSYVPVLSSMLMPMRLMDGSAQWWEGVIALALTLAFAAVAMVLGERMYRRSLMQTSSRMTFRQALTASD